MNDKIQIINSNNARNSSVELLRIIAMFFIVLSHSTVHGQFPSQQSLYLANNVLLQCLVLGNLGVDIFMLITGYYLCEKDNTTKSANKLHAQVLFYSLLGFLWGILSLQEISFKATVRAFFPVLFNEYWFITAYIVFLFFTPYINIFLINITRKQHLSCLSLMILLRVIMPTFTTQALYGDVLLQFLMFYLLGAYFRKYPRNIMRRPKIRFLTVVIATLLMILGKTLLVWLGQYIPTVLNYGWLIHSRNSLIVVGCAVGLFSLSIYRNSFHNKCINQVGICAFGVYLIHENPFVRDVLRGNWFQNYLYYNSKTLILHILVSVLVIYMACTIIEYLRKRYVETACIKVYNMLSTRLIVLIRKLTCRDHSV